MLHNWYLLGVCLFLGYILVYLLFSSGTRVSCAFKVNCDPQTYQAIQTWWLNAFLFEYEKVGGDVWFAPVVNGEPISTDFDAGFKWGVFFVLLLMSLTHVLLYRYVVIGKVCTEWIPRRLGWGDAFGAKLLERLRHVLMCVLMYRFMCVLRLQQCGP